MIVFQDSIQKAEPTYLDTSRRLRQLISSREPGLASFLVRTWGYQARAITYAELRAAIMAGSISESTIDAWRQDYATFVTEHLLPVWSEAMEVAAQQLVMRYPDYYYSPNAPHVRAWTERRAAELVVDITQQQREAINALVRRAGQMQDMGIDGLARVIRPTVGLYPQQAVANMRYYESVRQSLMLANPRMREETAAQKARLASVKYAEVQHRYRAHMIARTEIVNAYNHGELGGVKQAVHEGKMGRTVKRWVSADDARVCDICRELDGVEVELEDNFPGGYDAPTAHPHCRCVCAYIERE